MRVYFEKPRTTVGWKGLINDPHLNGSHDIATGLRIARQLLLDLAESGAARGDRDARPDHPAVPAPTSSRWTAIGARTTESQTHREMASGLSMPVGYKNGTDGGLTVADQRAHRRVAPAQFPGHRRRRPRRGRPHHRQPRRPRRPARRQRPARTTAPSTSRRRPRRSNRPASAPRMLVDCSHDNSGKSHLQQPRVVDEVGARSSAARRTSSAS